MIISSLILFSLQVFAQKKIEIEEDRTSPIAKKFNTLFDTMPKEVEFGASIYKNGEVYFSISNRNWFNQLFTNPKDGISIDVVSKDIYTCDKEIPESKTWKKGEWIKPMFLSDLKKGIVDLGNGHIQIKIGVLPQHLRNKEVEGNIGFIKNGKLCHYKSFLNIDRSVFQILPMGLFTENHIKYDDINDKNKDVKPSIFTKKIQFVIPFQKNKYDHNLEDIKPLYDSLKLTDYKIRKIVIRAYSSVEGSEDINRQLQKLRANAIVKALQQFQNVKIETEVTTAENWVEFIRDIQNTSFENLSSLRHPDVKSKLIDKDFALQLEPILQNHRKAITTIYLDKRTGFEEVIEPSNILNQFKKAIQEKNTETAGSIQKEVFDRIYDNRLPTDYLNKLEIPAEKSFISLLNNQGVYRYLLSVDKDKNLFETKGTISVLAVPRGHYLIEYDLEAIKQFEKYRIIDPENAKINYNICSLKFKLWKFDSTIVSSSEFWKEIVKIRRSNEIDISLARRMVINYHILMSEQHQSRFEYDLKDSSVSFIYQKYKDLNLNDRELYSLAKFLVYYSRDGEATEIVSDKMDKIDVDEDLLFYYINLMFYDNFATSDPDFIKAVQNATSINKKRFCHFFDSTDKGGAGFSLLEDKYLRGFYCKYCEW